MCILQPNIVVALECITRMICPDGAQNPPLTPLVPQSLTNNPELRSERASHPSARGLDATNSQRYTAYKFNTA